MLPSNNVHIECNFNKILNNDLNKNKTKITKLLRNHKRHFTMAILCIKKKKKEKM